MCGGCNALLGDKLKIENKNRKKPRKKNPGASKFIIKSDYNNENIDMLLGALIVLFIEDAEQKNQLKLH